MAVQALIRACGAALLAVLLLLLVALPLNEASRYASILLLLVGFPVLAWLYSLPRTSFTTYGLNAVAITGAVSIAMGFATVYDDNDMNDAVAFLVGVIVGSVVAAVGLVAGAFVLLLSEIAFRR